MQDNTVARNIETIQAIFQRVQASYSDNAATTDPYTYLSSFDDAFRSIAYEAASMSIALEDFKSSGTLTDWFVFLSGAGDHATQIHVGLGWAFAQMHIDPLPVMQELAPMMRYRVADGYGYYEGIFRRRKSVLSQEKPYWPNATAMAAYDQGLGRSIWYNANGDAEAAAKMISSFPAARCEDLWRGIGIALTYVGGCTPHMLTALATMAGIYKPQLRAGSVMSMVSRMMTGFIPRDNGTIYQLLTNDLVENLPNFVPDFDAEEDEAYQEWIAELEELMGG